MLKKILAFRAVYGALLVRVVSGRKTGLEIAQINRTFFAAIAMGVFCPVLPAGFERFHGPGIYSLRAIQETDRDGISFRLKKRDKVFDVNHEPLAETACRELFFRNPV